MTTSPKDVEQVAVDQQAARIGQAGQIQQNKAAIDLLRSWLEEEDAEELAEQRETWEYLKRS